MAKSDKIAGLSLREAKHLQALEGNPLDADEAAMFDAFERDNLSPAERRARIEKRIWRRAGAPAAE